jgi:hypothetical protein
MTKRSQELIRKIRARLAQIPVCHCFVQQSKSNHKGGKMTTVSQNLQNAAVEYTNQPDTHIDLDGDVWDGRGFWWNDDKKRHFLEHIYLVRRLEQRK